MVLVPGVSPQNEDWEQFRSFLLWPLPSGEFEVEAGYVTHLFAWGFFSNSFVIKTEVHDSEKIRFWSFSQNQEINASDQQK